jgi:signal transduction histidine kinase
VDAGGGVLASRISGPTLSEILSGSAATGITTIDTPAGRWRVHVARETLHGTTLLLVVVTPLSELAREQHEARQAILFGVPIALLLAGAGGLWLASIGLRPIREMARRAVRLAPTGVEDLGAPIRDDELGQLTRAFNGLVARLRSALDTQRRFMADASHELRSPVSVIRAAAEVTLGRDHRDEADYREALAVAGAQARRLGALVDDMLILARADAGGYPIRSSDFYLDDAIDECRQAVALLAAARGVVVSASGACDVAIRGDAELLRRLLFNVLQNAVQHTPRAGSVSVDVTVNASDVAIRVTDGGVGIPPEDRTRIFERFVQLDPSRRGEGAGLGLTIAKWVAEAHGGSLAVESSGPRGSTFCVTLPRAPRAPDPSPGPAPRPLAVAEEIVH